MMTYDMDKHVDELLNNPTEIRELLSRLEELEGVSEQYKKWFERQKERTIELNELYKECQADAIKMHKTLTEIANHDLITEHENADEEGNDLIYKAQAGLGRAE